LTDNQVDDELRASQDPKLPFVARALDPTVIADCIAPMLGGEGDDATAVQFHEARVVRHRPGRRCVIEYRFDPIDASSGRSSQWVFAKLRARGADLRTHRLLEAFWKAGFRPGAERNTAVPEPIGVVPELHMTIQRGVPGKLATELATGPSAVEVMGRIAEALHDLHFAEIPARRSHTLADELRILDEQLRATTQVHPEWSQRIERILRACERLASRLRPSPIRGIHRDFYPEQVIVDGAQLTLLDLDLYAAGDPALDIGNFVAHLTEEALRCYGDPDALSEPQRALEERYRELSDEVAPDAVGIYSTLTLVRHIHISSRIPRRRHMTSDIMELCEQRLGVTERTG
jgi:hypothetical protein